MPTISELINQKIYTVTRAEYVSDNDMDPPAPFIQCYLTLEGAKKACEEDMEEFKNIDIKYNGKAQPFKWIKDPDNSEAEALVLAYGEEDGLEGSVNWIITETTLAP